MTRSTTSERLLMGMTAIAAVIAAAVSITVPVFGDEGEVAHPKAATIAPQPSIFEMRQASRLLPDLKPEG